MTIRNGVIYMKNISVTEWCSNFIRQQVMLGDLCIDATMGNGNDTLLLCQLVGEEGYVHAFDIQETALANTQARLTEAGIPDIYALHLDSHENMADYVEEASVSCIVYNFGYLPGGDHTKATHARSSIQALKASLPLLKKGGILSLCIYSGGDTGFEERDAILSWVQALPAKKYLVIRTDFYNRPNHPPIPMLVIKL